MKIFVPRYRHDLPHVNGHILNEMFSEIDEKDLPSVIEFWKQLNDLSKLTAKTIFTRSIKEVCKTKPLKRTLEPFLRRPHITVHCGSKPGPAIAQETIYETGRLVGEYGFNFWYGGGDDGLMAKGREGFEDAIRKQRYPDQYSAQIMPADFAFPQQRSSNGMKPANEGLSKNTDIAIILPDFVTRRELLDSTCGAAITGFGGLGSLDELTDILVHIKTGLRNTSSYIVNSHVPELGHGYYDSFLQQIKDCIVCGLESPKIFDHVEIVSNPREAMDHLMEKLDKAGKNPHIVYAEYCREHNISPSAGQPEAPAVRLVR